MGEKCEKKTFFPIFKQTLIHNRRIIVAALKHTIGSYILNGNWTNSWPGDYEGAGTVFTYRKENGGNFGEAIFASGPLTESVDLIVNVHLNEP